MTIAELVAALVKHPVETEVRITAFSADRAVLASTVPIQSVIGPSFHPPGEVPLNIALVIGIASV